jgi:hypothetical protein
LNAGTSEFSGDVTGTVAGTAASTVVNTANSALSGLSTKLNSDARNVLAGSGGLATGTLNWNSSGVRTSGFGVGITQAGLVAYNSAGATTFVLNGTTGDATFAGALSAASGTFAGSLSAASGTFTGSLSAATGSFSGTLTASAINAVNTINIAGNAVTVPASAFTQGSIGVSSTNVWVPVQALVIATTGSRVFVATSGSAVDGSVPVGDSTFELRAIFRLTRNNVELAQSSSPAISFSDTPTASTHTYALEMRAPYVATTTSFSSPTVSNRSMFSIETKR